MAASQTRAMVARLITPTVPAIWAAALDRRSARPAATWMAAGGTVVYSHTMSGLPGIGPKMTVWGDRCRSALISTSMTTNGTTATTAMKAAPARAHFAAGGVTRQNPEWLILR